MIISEGFGKCPICKKHRSTGNHRKCSRILQKRHNHEEAKKVYENQRLEEVRAMAIKASYKHSHRIEYMKRYQAS
nr:MAG TPA: hypothetical protein [Caudoviricetes sp.]